MMLKRIQRGLEFDEENLARDDIGETGPGGMFIDRPRTYALMKETMFLSEIADRDARNRWEKLGALDTQTRALKRVREILARDYPAFVSPDVDARIRAAFQDLPPGDLVPPAEWQPA